MLGTSIIPAMSHVSVIPFAAVNVLNTERLVECFKLGQAEVSKFRANTFDVSEERIVAVVLKNVPYPSR